MYTPSCLAPTPVSCIPHLISIGYRLTLAFCGTVLHALWRTVHSNTRLNLATPTGYGGGGGGGGYDRGGMLQLLLWFWCSGQVVLQHWVLNLWPLDRCVVLAGRPRSVGLWIELNLTRSFRLCASPCYPLAYTCTFAYTFAYKTISYCLPFVDQLLEHHTHRLWRWWWRLRQGRYDACRMPLMAFLMHRSCHELLLLLRAAVPPFRPWHTVVAVVISCSHARAHTHHWFTQAMAVVGAAMRATTGEVTPRAGCR